MCSVCTAKSPTQLTGLLYKEGGPVVGIQLDNEYMHCGAPWEVTFKPGTEWVPAGSEGASHILKLKQIAVDAGLDVPFYTCTGWLRSPVPEGEVLPMQGGYAFTLVSSRSGLRAAADTRIPVSFVTAISTRC